MRKARSQGVKESQTRSRGVKEPRSRPRRVDPVDVANAQVLADRAARTEAARPVLPDLGLGLKQKEPATAGKFMDTFDKKAFGYEAATITKIIYGPDPLVDGSPAFRQALEEHGREDLAHYYREAILTKGAAAMPDPLMQRSLALGITQFGAEAVAEAFYGRVLKIPFRTVEIDASDELDPEILGSSVLAETVKRYERPGMAYRFFTELCVARLGWRGYTPVKEAGDIVKAGTLMLGEIRREIVEQRRMRQAQIARDKLSAIQDDFGAAADEARGVAALRPGESVTANRAGGDDPEGYLGSTRTAGVDIGRE